MSATACVYSGGISDVIETFTALPSVSVALLTAVTTVEAAGHAQYLVDNKELKKIILKMFYKIM